jgi:DNA-binding beta-propeller fold protein YncE
VCSDAAVQISFDRLKLRDALAEASDDAFSGIEFVALIFRLRRQALFQLASSMNRLLRSPFASSLVLACLAFVSPLAAAPSDGAYHVARTFHIGGSGGWDYLTVDPEHHLLFVPRSTHTMVIDASTGKTVADIPGQKRNHGVALVPAVGRGFISDGGDGSVVVFDLKTYRVLGKLKAEPDADGIIYDPESNKVLVVSGDGGVLIPISPDVDPVKGNVDGRIELGGEPEFLAADGHGHVYINLMNKNEVAVVDIKSASVVAHWSTAPGGSPVGMSMDRERRRLFIGCRNPAKMIVMSTDDGKVLADLPIGAGVDATQFDGNALASCADGTLTVVSETSPGKFEVVQTVATKPGARTMGLDSKTRAFYLPTAEFETPVGKARPTAKPDTFMILEVAR